MIKVIVNKCKGYCKTCEINMICRSLVRKENEKNNMDVVKNEVMELVKKELDSANQKFELFHRYMKAMQLLKKSWKRLRMN